MSIYDKMKKEGRLICKKCLKYHLKEANMTFEDIMGRGKLFKEKGECYTCCKLTDCYILWKIFGYQE